MRRTVQELNAAQAMMMQQVSPLSQTLKFQNQFVGKIHRELTQDFWVYRLCQLQKGSHRQFQYLQCGVTGT